MKKLRLSLILVLLSIVFGQYKDLTLEDVFKKSPFKYASLGKWKWLPDQDVYLFFKMDTSIKAKSLYSYDLAKGDTTLFISGDKFKFGDYLLGVDDYIIHPRGHKILLVTKRERIWRHSRKAIYYIFDLKTEEIVQLAGGTKLRNVKFSPNGSSLAYLREDNNLYVYQVDSEKEIQLTEDGSFNILNGHFGWVYEEEFSSYDAYRWSPDNKYLAFVREDQTNVKQFPMIDELKTYPEVKYHHYPKVGEDNPVLDIGIINIKNKKTKWLDLSSEEEMYHPRMTWLTSEQSKSGKQELIVTRVNRHQNRMEFVRFNIAKGKGQKFWEDISEAWVRLTDDVFYLNDGSFITLSERSGYNHIYHFDIDGKLIRQVTKGDWEVSGITDLDEEDNIIYFNGKKASVIESRLYSINFDGSDLKLLTKEPGWHKVYFSPSKNYYIDSYSSAKRPVSYELYKSNGMKIRDLSITGIEQFAEYGFSETKFIQVPTSDDGTLLNAMITLPRDFNPNNKYPVIVYGYSGPGSQVVANRTGRGLWDKYMNQEGYITFSIDPRGTGGRGTDFKYLSYKDIGKWVAIDQVEGAKYLKSLPYVDGDRIGIWGWSGGGYMTALCMTVGAPNFKVGVSVAGNYDLKLYDTIWTERYMGLLNENPDGYKNANVLTHAGKLEGKLLIIHGTGDDNVHSQHATQLMDELVKFDKHADFLTYANRNHGIYGGNTTFHLWTRITNYFKENL